MNDVNTRKLIELYRKTDSRKAFEILIINHQNALKLAIKDLPNNVLNREDLFSYANDFLIMAIQKKFNLKKKTKFVTYLINTAKFYCIDKIRSSSFIAVDKKTNERKMVFNESFDEAYMERQEDFNDIFEQKELLDIMIEKIQKLPRNEKIILGCVMQGIKLTEIAKQVECSVSRISQLYNKGLKKLKLEMSFAK